MQHAPHSDFQNRDLGEEENGETNTHIIKSSCIHL